MFVAERIRLAIIDPQPLFRAGLLACLKTDKSFEIVFEGHSPADALRAAYDVRPDVMLFDPQTHTDAIIPHAIRTVALACSTMRLIVLTTSEDEDLATALLRDGIHGYVLKDVTFSELCRAIEAVRHDQVYVTPSLGARLVSRALRPDAPVPVQPIQLSSREEQILSRAATGLTNKEIALSFKLSEKTVKYYMTNIMKKMHVRNRVEAVMMSSNGGRRELA